MARLLLLPVLLCCAAAEDATALLQSGLRLEAEELELPEAEEADVRPQAEDPFHPNKNQHKPGSHPAASGHPPAKGAPKAGLPNGLVVPEHEHKAHPNLKHPGNKPGAAAVAPVINKQRCNAVEVSRLHRAWAGDLNSVFMGANGGIGFQWPDMSDKNKIPGCQFEDLVLEETLDFERFMWCYAKRLQLSLPCATCFGDWTKKLRSLQNPQASMSPFGSKQQILGCTGQCFPSMMACKHAFTDTSQIGECLGEPLAKCLKCMGPATDRLTECLGDSSPFTPNTFHMMVTAGIAEGHGGVTRAMVEFIQGAGMQAMVDEELLRRQGIEPSLSGPPPKVAPQPLKQDDLFRDGDDAFEDSDRGGRGDDDLAPLLVRNDQADEEDIAEEAERMAAATVGKNVWRRQLSGSLPATAAA